MSGLDCAHGGWGWSWGAGRLLAHGGWGWSWGAGRLLALHTAPTTCAPPLTQTHSHAHPPALIVHLVPPHVHVRVGPGARRLAQQLPHQAVGLGVGGVDGALHGRGGGWRLCGWLTPASSPPPTHPPTHPPTQARPRRRTPSPLSAPPPCRSSQPAAQGTRSPSSACGLEGGGGGGRHGGCGVSCGVRACARARARTQSSHPSCRPHPPTTPDTTPTRHAKLREHPHPNPPTHPPTLHTHPPRLTPHPPGMSNSGSTLTPRARAYATTRATSRRVYRALRDQAPSPSRGRASL